MIVAGVPSLAEVRTTASRDREPGRDVLLVAEEEARARDAELVRALLEALAVVAVADEEEQRVDTALAERDERRQQVVGLLDGGHAAEPADDERLARDPVAPADLAPHRRRTRRARSSSRPSRTTVNFSAGATPSATSSSRTSGLTATSRSVARASTVSIPRKTSVPARPK